MAISSAMGPRVANNRLPRTMIPASSLAHDSQRHVLTQGVNGGGRATPLQVQQGVGEGHIMLTDEFVVLEHVVLELGAVLGEVVGGSSPGCKDHVEEVRRAPHHPATGPGPAG